MSLFYYDKAMFAKIKALYPETFFAAPEDAFSVNAKNHSGTKVVMPFISVWRLPDLSINAEYLNDSMVRQGKFMRPQTHGNPEFGGTSYVSAHGLPVTLQYQIDVYATKRQICDGLAAELALEFYEKPYVDVKIDSIDRVVQFNVDLDSSISDNSDISSFDETGRFYRLTLTAEIQSAYIYRVGKSFANEERDFVDLDSLDSPTTEESETV